MPVVCGPSLSLAVQLGQTLCCSAPVPIVCGPSLSLAVQLGQTLCCSASVPVICGPPLSLAVQLGQTLCFDHYLTRGVRLSECLNFICKKYKINVHSIILWYTGGIGGKHTFGLLSFLWRLHSSTCFSTTRFLSWPFPNYIYNKTKCSVIMIMKVYT